MRGEGVGSGGAITAPGSPRPAPCLAWQGRLVAGSLSGPSLIAAHWPGLATASSSLAFPFLSCRGSPLARSGIESCSETREGGTDAKQTDLKGQQLFSPSPPLCPIQTHTHTHTSGSCISSRSVNGACTSSGGREMGREASPPLVAFGKRNYECGSLCVELKVQGNRLSGDTRDRFVPRSCSRRGLNEHCKALIVSQTSPGCAFPPRADRAAHPRPPEPRAEPFCPARLGLALSARFPPGTSLQREPEALERLYETIVSHRQSVWTPGK